jgi:hypothetical protein
MPSAFISGLSGIQSMPPDIPVEPPTTPCFSTITGLRPAAWAASAAASPPPPLPTITMSKDSVCSAM